MKIQIDQQLMRRFLRIVEAERQFSLSKTIYLNNSLALESFTQGDLEEIELQVNSLFPYYSVRLFTSPSGGDDKDGMPLQLDYDFEYEDKNEYTRLLSDFDVVAERISKQNFVYEIGEGLVFDTQHNILVYMGKKIKVSAESSSWHLLKLLVSEPAVIHTAEEIVSYFNSKNESLPTVLLEDTKKYLRKRLLKINYPNELIPQMIKLVPGEGYILGLPMRIIR